MGIPATLPGPVVQPPSNETPIYTIKPLVGFATRNVQPPPAVYVTVDDRIHLSVWNSVPGITINVTYRILKADGEISLGGITFQPTSNRARNDQLGACPEGFLFSVDMAITDGTVLRGQCFCELDVARITGSAPEDRQPLFSDYLQSANTLGWPGGRQISSVEGPGAVLTQSLTNEPGNTFYTFSVPTGARWVLRGMWAELTTSSTAGNRTPSVLLQASSGVNIYNAAALVAQAASTTFIYSFANVGIPMPSASTFQIVPLSVPLVLPAGGTITLSLAGGLASDTWNNINIEYEEWIEAAS